MERMFRINWRAIVEEAKQRRKGQRLTQRRLGQLAGVSTPTVSRFESGSEDIQLSSATSILDVLGMMDKRFLSFEDSQPHYDPRHMVVRFDGKDGDVSISCAISFEALEDHFEAGRDPVKAFHGSRERIEHEARRKYLAGRLEADGSVLVRTTDF